MNKNVLIIGGNGYLGRHLYPKLLEENFYVTITGVDQKSNATISDISHIDYFF